MTSTRYPNLMYHTDDNFEVDVPAEVESYRSDLEALGVVNDLENWYVTSEWADKFNAHYHSLLPLAEQGNVLAQYSLAVILLTGTRYTSREIAEAHHSQDLIQMSRWLEMASRAGYMGAIEILVGVGVGEEAERLRRIMTGILQEKESGATFPAGETWRRAYG